jgi:hypothetical protein
LAVKQAWDLILDEQKLNDKTKQESGTLGHLPQSPEHQLTPATPASVLPPDPHALTSPTTSVPQEAPEKSSEETNPEEGKDHPATKDDPATGA